MAAHRPATGPFRLRAAAGLLLRGLVALLGAAVLLLAGATPVTAAAAGTGASPVTAAAGGLGDWRWPVPGPPSVGRGFDPPSLRWAAGHRGVDLVAPAGSPVTAAGAGRVAFSGPLAGRGVVVVSHPDGTRTTYEPLLPAVSVGDPVSAGDLLGHLAPSAGHCLPRSCLHWGRLRGRVYLDPLALVGAARARLLPVWSRETGA
ncbi:MAG TPA: peptidoglycan DD-metalloendopeptidase family protein, partial [Actinomycetes bacterium]